MKRNGIIFQKWLPLVEKNKYAIFDFLLKQYPCDNSSSFQEHTRVILNMGKKSRPREEPAQPVKPDIWCFYCERDFQDEKILIQHQKAKHYMCPHCSKKLSTAGIKVCYAGYPTFINVIL